jgi:flotillin
MASIFSAISPFIIPVLIVIAVLLILGNGYVKAPPDNAYIISGLKKGGKILIGRAGIKIPFFERLDRLYLGQMTVDIKTEQSVPTNDFINVNVDAVAKVRISPTVDGIQLAAKNFLNKAPEDIARDLQDSLQGNMREIIGTLSLKEINTDRDSFSDQVMQKASKDMDKLGIEILSCNIQNVTDEKGLIQDLGADNTSLIKKNAAIAKAQADRDVAINKAQAAQEANDAKIAAAAQIAARNAEFNQKQADLKKTVDTQQAQADAAKDIEAEKQRQLKDVAATNANIAKAEREAELKQKEIQLKEYELDALVRKQADADKYAAEKKAEADLIRRQKDAEAKAYEIEQAATAQKAKADADKYSAEQQAAGIMAVGEAEAAAIEKKAEAQKKMGEASVLEMYFNALPKVVASAAAPLEKVNSITMYGDGNNAKFVGDVMQSTNQVIEAMKANGIDIQSLLDKVTSGKITKQ